MFHWFIASAAWVFDSLDEFTSRIPSALALTLLTTATFAFFAGARRRNSVGTALLAAAVMFTSFECFRAGTNCRVDMVLTMFMSTAIMALYNGLTKRKLLWYALAALLLSGAALTKGPVGILLPLGVFWIYALLRGYNMLKVSLITLLVLILGSILPALWYYCAWQRGGDRFFSLAMEENFGRLLGNMSYDSHVKPLWYNFTSLLSGLLPWSLLLLCTVPLYFRAKKRNANRPSAEDAGSPSFVKHLRKSLRTMDPYLLLSIVASAVILIFYCIPASKRSVYLLPMYPFLGYLLATYFSKLARCKIMGRRSLAATVATVCVLYLIGYAIVYPAIVNPKSDKLIAAEIKANTPSEADIYTFIPDRFMRYFITDHYLGYRMKPLLPSGQVFRGEGVPKASDIDSAPQGVFYLAVSEKVWDAPQVNIEAAAEKDTDYGLHSWLKANSLKAIQIYRSERSTHDVKGRLVLLKVSPTSSESTLP